MNPIDFEKLNNLYSVNIEEFEAAALEGAAEHHFTLDGREVPPDGSDE